MQNNKGYTLIELVVVVSILSVLLMVAIPGIKKPEANEAELFFEVLEKDLYYAQIKAITDGLSVHFVFNAHEGYYKVMQGRTELRVRTFPEGLNFSGTSMGLSNPRFLPSGRIERSGTTSFIYHGSTIYRVVFVFIRGRFYIEKI
ncbi:prepilin-type N-terminal cleavage/methylation domain-containing protein [Alteribacter aurantiacus]|uniref:prepilin-type N-terminal cleavage/methylation domain-containing protein n=1 Tax=Alteribacter aurantiacus TaxID=254410 RepID=UPI000406A9EA|nr:prepilin-type N-terminal cleavage/methylation domain-containing protein [Alteribacter aurantiacus]